jgi:hypothetical protein
MRTLVLALLAALLLPPVAGAQAEADKLRAAKTLYFDRQYAEAREAWRAVHAAGHAPEAQVALYWIARCIEGLGERERALAEYDQYLATRPADRALVEEAKTSRVALAVKLVKGGQGQYVAVLKEALADPNRTVRYFAALQMAALGPGGGQAAVPVLKEILARESDEDLVERAKLALLRLDRTALAEASPAPAARGAAREASWIRVRIYEKGAKKPSVSINLPVALAEMVFKSLPDDTRAELAKKGYDADTFWARLKKTGPTEILTVEGEDGERIQVWIE